MKIPVFTSLVVIFFFAACKMNSSEKLNYPKTKKVDTVDTYFGMKVSDPYRWLENDKAEEVKTWVDEENKVTQQYLSQISFKGSLKEEIRSGMNYERRSALKKHGDYYYYYRNSGLQNQSVLYRLRDPKDTASAEVFLDPNTFSKDGKITLQGTSFTKDGALMAYLTSAGGSDWRNIHIVDTQTGRLLEDSVRNAKFTDVAWKGNEGFYYSTYEIPEGEDRLTYKTIHHSLYYHQLGTDQQADSLIFGGERQPHRYISGYLTEDERFLVINAAETTTGNELYIQDLSKSDSEIIPIVQDLKSEQNIVDNEGGTLYIYTNREASHYKLIQVDFSSPEPGNWKDVIPESGNVLKVSTAGNYFMATYMEDVKDRVFQYDRTGHKVREIELPASGSVEGFSSPKESAEVYYSFTSFTYPGSVYQYDLGTGNSELYWQPQLDFTPEEYETKQVFYPSRDGTKIPMYLVYKKGLELTGKNPTYLYAYGGFNISLLPAFSSSRMVWLNHGGLYAQPNLRGGGEYGKAWHKAGTRMQKQNVFDDFIAAADYLISEKYTSSDYLAIAGGSNGGLLVGATMTQQPDLMKVALPAVGVLDMLRYNKFTAGAGWATDYGTAEDSKEMFEYLLRYSPLQNIKEGISYPATMVFTADHDDRVVPAHSFKFAATLQERNDGDNPMLIRIQKDAGHGTGMDTEKLIDELTDRYAFIWYNMRVDPFEKRSGKEAKNVERK